MLTLWSDTEIELAAGKGGACAQVWGRFITQVGDGPLKQDLNKLLRGLEFGKYVSILSTPAMFGMDGVATHYMCICACVAFAAANLVLKAPLGNVILSMLFQMVVGLSAAHFCIGGRPRSARSLQV